MVPEIQAPVGVRSAGFGERTRNRNQKIPWPEGVSYMLFSRVHVESSKPGCAQLVSSPERIRQLNRSTPKEIAGRCASTAGAIFSVRTAGSAPRTALAPPGPTRTSTVNQARQHRGTIGIRNGRHVSPRPNRVSTRNPSCWEAGRAVGRGKFALRPAVQVIGGVHGGRDATERRPAQPRIHP